MDINSPFATRRRRPGLDASTFDSGLVKCVEIFFMLIWSECTSLFVLSFSRYVFSLAV